MNDLATQMQIVGLRKENARAWKAVAAERERCAKIADDFARANAHFNDGTDAPAAVATASAIAAQIRKE